MSTGEDEWTGEWTTNGWMKMQRGTHGFGAHPSHSIRHVAEP